MSPTAASTVRPEREPAACFSVHAEAAPEIMPRVLELFAKRGVVPTSWISRVVGCDLTIDLQICGLDREAVGYIARCLRQIVGVDIVLTSEKR